LTYTGGGGLILPGCIKERFTKEGKKLLYVPRAFLETGEKHTGTDKD